MSPPPPERPSNAGSPGAFRRLGGLALPPLLTLGLALVLGGWLHQGVLGDPAHLRILGAFHDGHVWAFDRMARGILGQEPLGLTTPMAAFPGRLDIRYIAWVPALLALPFRPFLGPLGAYNVVVLLSPALAALAAWGLFRRVLRANPWTAAISSLAWAFCPFILGNLANGQTEKASHWLLPLFLWALGAFLEGPAWVLPGLALVLATWMAAFTEPTLTLLLPLAAVCQGAWWVWVAPKRPMALLRLVLAAMLAMAALAPAWAYYMGPPVEGASVLNPGPEFSGDILPDPPPVATFGDTFLGTGRREINPALCNHITYLGLPLLATLLVLGWRRARGRGLVLAWFLTGTVLAFGPRLAWDGQWVRVDGRHLLLPAALLDLAGYPLKQAGMYYRVILLGSLGLAGLLATSTTWIRRPWVGVALAWILGVGAVADGVRATRPLWPRPVAAVPAASLLERMGQDPVPGAVLDLPMETDTWGNGLHLLSAVLHGRATTALAAHTRISDTPNLARVSEDLSAAFVAGDSEGTRSRLHERGYRYVVWRTQPRSFGRGLPGWTTVLGTPMVEDGVRYWVLGPP